MELVVEGQRMVEVPHVRTIASNFVGVQMVKEYGIQL